MADCGLIFIVGFIVLILVLGFLWVYKRRVAYNDYMARRAKAKTPPPLPPKGIVKNEDIGVTIKTLEYKKDRDGVVEQRTLEHRRSPKPSKSYSSSYGSAGHTSDRHANDYVQTMNLQSTIHHAANDSSWGGCSGSSSGSDSGSSSSSCDSGSSYD